MVTKQPHPARRYRRRILGVGLLFTGVACAATAPIYNGRIESDLERRVPQELVDAGFGTVTAEFSGQDGVLSCEQPLARPEAARQAAYDVWGVHAIDLDRSCRVNRAPVVEPADATSDTTPATNIVGETGPVATVVVSVEDTGADFETVGAVLASDPRYSLLAVLAAEAGLDERFDDAEADPITVFAPTDAAFDELPADVLARLRSDPEVLKGLLEHHLTAGSLLEADLSSGPLVMADGATATVVVGDAATSIGDATIIDADIVTGNGVVQAVDAIILPSDFDLSPDAASAPASAAMSDGVITLTGVVASEAERARLVEAAGGVGSGVVDQLTVDPSTGLNNETTAGLADLIATMRANLLSGEVTYDGVGFAATGVYADTVSGDAMGAAVEALDGTHELSPRPDATIDDAAALEAALNLYVTENPILFEPGLAVLTPSAVTVIDEVARQAQQFGEIDITVEGHTDSDGAAEANLLLSQQRAVVVRDALIERGLDGTRLEAVGFGSEQPVVVDGQEDKAASRRVEFRVAAVDVSDG